MRTEKKTVAVIGAGLGGLCLAQGLRRAGIPFLVHERDAAASPRAQGFRIRIDAAGQAALRACLPESLMRLVEASASLGSSSGQMLDAQLQAIRAEAPPSWHREAEANAEAADDDTPRDLSLDRRVLREILMAGIEPVVRFGQRLDGYRIGPDGRVQLEFEGGTRATCDVLVGADGVSSIVRRQLQPDATPEDSGTACVYGRADRSLVEGAAPGAARLAQATSVVLAEECALILDDMIFRPELRELAASCAPACSLNPPRDYFYWALLAPRQRIGIDPANPELADGCRERLAGLAAHWHPALRHLLLATPLDAISALPVRNGRPKLPVPPGPVTLLGDAAHAMSPAGGLGGGTAFQDAQALAGFLWRLAESSGSDHLAALAAYSLDLRERGSAAVERSRRASETLLHRAGASSSLQG